jgi:hypothetical protein
MVGGSSEGMWNGASEADKTCAKLRQLMIPRSCERVSLAKKRASQDI